MTKTELEKKLKELEQELHNSQNSVDYWNSEYNSILKKLEELESKIDNDIINSFLINCSIIEKDKLENFILEEL